MWWQQNLVQLAGGVHGLHIHRCWGPTQDTKIISRLWYPWGAGSWNPSPANTEEPLCSTSGRQTVLSASRRLWQPHTPRICPCLPNCAEMHTREGSSVMNFDESAQPPPQPRQRMFPSPQKRFRCASFQVSSHTPSEASVWLLSPPADYSFLFLNFTRTCSFMPAFSPSGSCF